MSQALETHALLAIDPPPLSSGVRAPSPCRILDAGLRPISSTLADGMLHRVPAGTIVVILNTSDGIARRKVLLLTPGREYRLHYARRASDLPDRGGGPLVEEEARRLMRFLQLGQVREARELCHERLAQLRRGDMGDPIIAAAVGYVLLQTWEYNAMQPWCFYLPREHPWLADGYVIAGELHAATGNNLTALNYLRQLERRQLPIFTVGLSRAIDRLAVLRTQRAGDFGRTEHTTDADGAEPAGSAQVLNPWDVEAAAESHAKLSARIGQVGLWSGTTLAADTASPDQRNTLTAMYQRLVQLVGERAAASAYRGRNAKKGATSMATGGGERAKEKSGLTGVPMYVAIAAIGVWLAFVVVMLVLSGTDNTRWTRIAYVFGSVEAIAFAAAGALFGVSVQRARVERAEEKADTNEKDATNGRALASINLADEGRTVLQDDGEATFEAYGPSDTPDADLRRRHADAARRLFPDL